MMRGQGQCPGRDRIGHDVFSTPHGECGRSFMGRGSCSRTTDRHEIYIWIADCESTTLYSTDVRVYVYPACTGARDHTRTHAAHV